MDGEFIRKLYERELDEKLALDTRPNFYAISLAAVAGVVSVAYKSLPSEPFWMRVTWLVGVTVSAVAFIVAVLKARSFSVGNTYNKIATAKLFQQHFEELQAYHKNNPTDPCEPKDAFQADVESRMIEAATINAVANARRGELHVQIVNWLVVCVAAAAAPILAREMTTWYDTLKSCCSAGIYPDAKEVGPTIAPAPSAIPADR